MIHGPSNVKLENAGYYPVSRSLLVTNFPKTAAKTPPLYLFRDREIHIKDTCVSCTMIIRKAIQIFLDFNSGLQFESTTFGTS